MTQSKIDSEFRNDLILLWACSMVIAMVVVFIVYLITTNEVSHYELVLILFSVYGLYHLIDRIFKH